MTTMTMTTTVADVAKIVGHAVGSGSVFDYPKLVALFVA
jgi:hypothetical protein